MKKFKKTNKYIKQLSELAEQHQEIYNNMIDIYNEVMSVDLISDSEMIKFGARLTKVICDDVHFQKKFEDTYRKTRKNFDNKTKIILIALVLNFIFIFVQPIIAFLIIIINFVEINFIIPEEIKEIERIIENSNIYNQQKEMGTISQNITTFIEKKYEMYKEKVSKEVQNENFNEIIKTQKDKEDFFDDFLVNITSINAIMEQDEELTMNLSRIKNNKKSQ